MLREVGQGRRRRVLGRQRKGNSGAEEQARQDARTEKAVYGREARLKRRRFHIMNSGKTPYRLPLRKEARPPSWKVAILLRSS